MAAGAGIDTRDDDRLRPAVERIEDRGYAVRELPRVVQLAVALAHDCFMQRHALILVDQPQFVIAIVEGGQTVAQSPFLERPAYHMQKTGLFAVENSTHGNCVVVRALDLVELQKGRVGFADAPFLRDCLRAVDGENRKTLIEAFGRFEAGAEPMTSTGPLNGVG